MAQRTVRTAWMLLVGFLAVGCGNEVHAVPSENINTRNVRAEISVIAESNTSTTVAAWVFHGDDTLDLSAEDTLVARHGVFALEMARVYDEIPATWGGFKYGDEVHYIASFEDATPDSTFEVSFLRASDGHGRSGVSAPYSSVTLPAPFDVMAPEEDATINADGSLPVQISDESDSDGVMVAVHGKCIADHNIATYPNKGRVTVPRDFFERTDDDNDDCKVTLTVSRVREGDLDQHFGEGGFIDARQLRTVHLTLQGD